MTKTQIENGEKNFVSSTVTAEKLTEDQLAHAHYMILTGTVVRYDFALWLASVSTQGPDGETIVKGKP